MGALGSYVAVPDLWAVRERGLRCGFLYPPTQTNALGVRRTNL